MPDENTNAFASAKLAWSDVGRAAACMPNLTLAGVIAGFVYAGFDMAVENTPAAALTSLGGLMTGALFGAAWACFLAPFYLAIHRHIILDEVADGYSVAVEEPRFQRTFGCCLALYAITLVPSTALSVVPREGFSAFLAVCLVLLGLSFATRVMLVFPAVAVDAPGATFRNAYDDSRGQFWRIAGAILTTLAPLVIASAVIASAFGEDSGQRKIFDGMATILGLALTIALASRLYQRLGDRVGPPQRARAAALVRQQLS
jgi:hypothetical protein